MFIVLLVDDDILVIFGSHFYLICDFQYRFAKVFSYIFRSNQTQYSIGSAYCFYLVKYRLNLTQRRYIFHDSSNFYLAPTHLPQNSTLYYNRIYLRQSTIIGRNSNRIVVQILTYFYKQTLQTLIFLQIYRKMQNTINTYPQVLKLVPTLMQHKALGSLCKKSVPQWEKLSEYRCQMVVDQYENENGQFAQEYRLQFLHKKNGTRFSINITDLSYVKNTSYLFEWSKQSQQDASLILSDEISLRMSANCLNYQEQRKKEERYKSAKYQQKIKRQQTTTIASVKSEYGRKPCSIKKQYSKKQLINRADDVKRQNSEGSDFGSWVDEEFQQPKKKVEVASSKTPPAEKSYFDYRGYDDRNLIDYSQSTKINVRFKLLQFLRIKENRMKKLPEIKQYFRKCNYNVPDKPLKELIKELCVSHLMDRNKGYLLKDEYLTKSELAQRQEQHLKQMLEKKERDKKKRSKKQIKIQTPHQSFADTLSEVKNRKSASKKKGSK